MTEIEPLTWLDYEGPEFDYICPLCGEDLIDESTAAHADEVDPRITRRVDHDEYVSLRCPDFPVCPYWDASSEELKEKSDKIFSASE